MNATVAQLTARSLLGRRRALLLTLLPMILLVLAAVVSWISDADQQAAASLLAGFALTTMVPLLGLIVGTGSIGPEIDDGSIVYLLSKPLSRYSIVATKFVVAVAVVLATAAVPTFLAGVVLSGFDRVAAAFAVGVAVAGIGYCALFLLLAIVTRNAVILGLVYALIWESLIGSFVPGAQTLSINQWAMAVTETLLGDRAVELGVVSSVDLDTAIALLVIVVVGSVIGAGARLRTLRINSDE